VLRDRAGRPPDTVLCVELGGQRPPAEFAVELLLDQPGRELPVPVEAEARVHMSDYVVDGPKSVVAAAKIAAHQWVTTVSFPGARGDFQHSVRAHRAHHLIVGIVWTLTAGELDSETSMDWTICMCEADKDHIRLSFELVIGRTDRCIGVALSNRLEPGRYFAGKIWVNSPETLAYKAQAWPPPIGRLFSMPQNEPLGVAAGVA
jgi:hypothetical protein